MMGGPVPEYAACSCGEYHHAALRITPGGVRCFNCTDTRHRRGLCLVCEQSGPLEDHHIGGKRHLPQTIPVCLNCHQVLSRWQDRWHPSWRTTEGFCAAVLFSAQGILDIAQLRHDQLPPGDWRASIAALVLYALRLALRCWLPSVAVSLDHLVMPEGCLVTSVDR